MYFLCTFPFVSSSLIFFPQVSGTFLLPASSYHCCSLRVPPEVLEYVGFSFFILIFFSSLLFHQKSFLSTPFRMYSFCVPFLSSTPLSSSSTSFFPSFSYPGGKTIRQTNSKISLILLLRSKLSFLQSGIFSYYLLFPLRYLIHLSASPKFIGPVLPYHIRNVWYFSVQLPLSRTEYEGFSSFLLLLLPFFPMYQFLASIQQSSGTN